jgi:MFS family permease
VAQTSTAIPAHVPAAHTPAARRLVLPLALAQFICSFAGSNMNVMISDISQDLNTTVQGVQITITLFLVIMAVLMIPCSKLTDRWGRKRCFMLGLALYGVGALLSAVAPGLPVLILGNSVFEGVGTALLIPPVYILATIWFHDLTSRAWAFGAISGMGGIGSAAGPLIGGVITTGISWRAAFIFQAAVIVLIILLSRGMADPLPAEPDRPFDPGIWTIVSRAADTAAIVVHLPKGSLFVDGSIRHTKPSSPLRVAGGTGRYAGASGRMVFTYLSDTTASLKFRIAF